jgi:hypothetical protein
MDADGQDGRGGLPNDYKFTRQQWELEQMRRMALRRAQIRVAEDKARAERSLEERQERTTSTPPKQETQNTRSEPAGALSDDKMKARAGRPVKRARFARKAPSIWTQPAKSSSATHVRSTNTSDDKGETNRTNAQSEQTDGGKDTAKAEPDGTQGGSEQPAGGDDASEAMLYSIELSEPEAPEDFADAAADWTVVPEQRKFHTSENGGQLRGKKTGVVGALKGLWDWGTGK